MLDPPLGKLLLSMGHVFRVVMYIVSLASGIPQGMNT
jgi:hypothetical protein